MKNFEELGIASNFIKGLNELNIVKPTPIQTEVIPLLLNNKTDLIGQAQTGTGKTAAYGLPLLHNVDPKKKYIQALILCPTRELGQQVAKQLFKYTKYTEKYFVEAVYGGQPIDRQINALNRPTHIIVATPGRLIDLVKRKAVDLRKVKTIVLDEADEMLSMGFKKELEEILKFSSQTDQKWLFSATMPNDIKEIINTYMSNNAHRIAVNSDDRVNKNITHQYIICDELEKIHKLITFLKTQGNNRGIVFCRTKAATIKLTKQLIAKNIAADCIHGDLLQKERDKAMRAFKKETVQLLVATDIAARGIDIDSLSYVIHYQMPDQDEYYTHRSGRTARGGKNGVSLSLVTSFETKQLKHLERTLNINFDQIR